MAFQVNDTIAAIATAAGSGARGIIRISGPHLIPCLQRCVTTELAIQNLRVPRVLAAELHDAAKSLRIPCQLHLWPNQRSYTQQPSAELHMINSQPLLELALRLLLECGVRLATPGEFTQRAFLAGRIDLAQAEAVLGVIDARSAHELDVALKQLAGGLSQPVSELRTQLLDLLADLEAGLDFVDEDIEFVTPAELASRLTDANRALQQLIVKLETRSVGDRPWQCVLVGEPNVGKSSLFNALCSQSAIVSDSAGTTRDYVVGTLPLTADLRGHLLDTAGLELGHEPSRVESIFGEQQVTQQMLAQADLAVVCLDGSRGFTERTRSVLATCMSKPHVLVITKADLPQKLDRHQLPAGQLVVVSSLSGTGLNDLRRLLVDQLLQQVTEESPLLRATSLRCRASFLSAEQGMRRAIEVQQQQLGDELLATELQVVLDELGQIAGSVCSDDVLDRVFSRFCIGK